MQIEHHVTPFIPVENLQRMVPIVKELCLKYKCRYQDYKTFLHLWSDHYTYLYDLSVLGKSSSVDNEVANKQAY